MARDHRRLADERMWRSMERPRTNGALGARFPNVQLVGQVSGTPARRGAGSRATLETYYVCANVFFQLSCRYRRRTPDPHIQPKLRRQGGYRRPFDDRYRHGHLRRRSSPWGRRRHPWSGSSAQGKDPVQRRPDRVTRHRNPPGEEIWMTTDIKSRPHSDPPTESRQSPAPRQGVDVQSVVGEWLATSGAVLWHPQHIYLRLV